MINLQLHKKFHPLFKPKRIKVYFGGRGGMKTESMCRAAIVKAYKDGWKFLCARQHMNSIEDSVHAALSNLIRSEGFESYFDIQKSAIYGPGGSAFKYAQLASNLGSIKSKFQFNCAWVEEADDVDDEALNTLEPTLRAAGSEIWYSLNPRREDGPVWARYIKPHIRDIETNGFYEDDDLYVCRVGLEDNPWAPEELVKASAKMKEEDYDLWLHVYGGHPLRNLEDVIIQPKWVEAAIDAHKRLGFQPVGVRSLGFDPADSGDDKAVAMRHGSVVTHVHYWKDGDLSVAIDKAFSYADDYRADCLVYDADGLGLGVKVGLDKRLEGRHVTVTPYHGGAGVDAPEAIYKMDRSNKDTFKNLRAQKYWELRDRFEATYEAAVNGKYTDPDKLVSLDSSGIKQMDLLKSELTRPLRKRTNNSQIQVQSKADMTESPNGADAVVMCFANKLPTIRSFVMPQPIRPIGGRR